MRIPIDTFRGRVHAAFLSVVVGGIGPGFGPDAALAQELDEGVPPAGRPIRYVCPPFGPERASLDVIRYLAADDLEGRFSGTRGEYCAGEYIAASFEKAGLTPAGVNGFFQSLELASAATPHAPTGEGRNVLGLLEGADPVLREEVVVVGAHYDHLGHGGFGSTGSSGEIHNGADDNASGVAAMIEAARRLGSGPRPARSILFIAFTGEELGLVGSAFYTRNPVVPLERTVAMLNLDMVGRLEDDPLIVYGVGTAPEWEEMIRAANVSLGLPLAFEEAGYGPSDHTSFYANEIPVLHLFTNVHEDYHKHTDDWQKIDVEGLGEVARFTSEIALAVADRPGRLTVIPGVGERRQRAGGYGAWLGTVPDFTPVDHGVLLAGVGAGSPAADAGLQKGDILVGLGEFDVADLQAFTDALRAHQPGDEVIVRFLRDGETIERSVVLGSRTDREP